MRSMAGAFGFFTLIQHFALPERYRIEPLFFDPTPAEPNPHFLGYANEEFVSWVAPPSSQGYGSRSG